MYKQPTCRDSQHVETANMYKQTTCRDSQHVETANMYKQPTCRDSQHVETANMYKQPTCRDSQHVQTANMYKQPTRGCLYMLAVSNMYKQPTCTNSQHVQTANKVETKRLFTVEVVWKKAENSCSLPNKVNPLGDTSRPSSSHVRIIQAPDTLGAAVQLKVQYQCEEDGVVVVDLSVMNNDNYITVFSKAWKCKGQGLEGKPKTKRVKLHLPDSLEFRPDYFNKGLPMWLISLAKIRVWLVDQLKWSRPNESDLYTIAKSRDFVKLGVLPPYSRPFKSPACSIWIWPILQRLPRFSDSQTCVVEKERVVLLDYPAVFNGNTYGIIKQLSQYTDPGLERDRQERFWAPQLTLEMWVYIIEYCPLYRLNGAEGCGLFMHIDGQGKIFTPVLLINRHGNFQVDVQSATGYIGIKTNDVIPRNVWTRIVFTLDHRKWTVSANYGAGLKEGFTTSYT
uniref:Uncharacterized protein n=1 Tax=Biomphalaria glabrata TaxID=6526 RepID=A0A2C9JVM3_BIOGL